MAKNKYSSPPLGSVFRPSQVISERGCCYWAFQTGRCARMAMCVPVYGERPIRWPTSYQETLLLQKMDNIGKEAKQGKPSWWHSFPWPISKGSLTVLEGKQGIKSPALMRQVNLSYFGGRANFEIQRTYCAWMLPFVTLCQVYLFVFCLLLYVTCERNCENIVNLLTSPRWQHRGLLLDVKSGAMRQDWLGLLV